MVDGIQQRKGPELDDMIGRGFVGLMGASLLMNSGTVFTAMQNTIAPGGISGPGAFSGMSRMMGGFTNLVTTASYELGQLSAASTIMRMADPAQQRTPQNLPTPKYQA
jgi:hypothetical protein